MIIKLNDLSIILKKLLIYAREKNVNAIQINKNEIDYWYLCDDFFELKNQKEFCLGTFAEDIKRLIDILENDELSSTVDLGKLGFLIIKIKFEINRGSHQCESSVIKYSLDHLNNILDLSIKYLKILGFEKIEFTQDIYEKVCTDTMFLHEPKICKASLHSDISELYKILNKQKNVEIEDFERFGFLLLAIKNEVNKQI